MQMRGPAAIFTNIPYMAQYIAGAKRLADRETIETLPRHMPIKTIEFQVIDLMLQDQGRAIIQMGIIILKFDPPGGLRLPYRPWQRDQAQDAIAWVQRHRLEKPLLHIQSGFRHNRQS